MGSAGEPDRKRRHISSIPSTVTAAPNAMKGLSSPRSSEDRKLDARVLQYQNQKLLQQLETHRVEHSLLEIKLEEKKKKQNIYGEATIAVEESWQKLVDDLEALSFQSRGSSDLEDEFLNRLLQSGATECCTKDVGGSQMDHDGRKIQDKVGSILRNVISSIGGLFHVNSELSVAVSKFSTEDDLTNQLKEKVLHWQNEVKGLQAVLEDLHIKHRSLANEVQIQRDTLAKDEAQRKLLKGELESTQVELQECRTQMTALKAHKDGGQGAPHLYPLFGNNYGIRAKSKDGENELHDLQSQNKELMDTASDRLIEIRRLHEKKLEDLKRLSILQSTLTDLNSISSSEVFRYLSDLLQKSKDEMDQHQVSLEELQAEKDNYAWKEKEVLLKLELADVSEGALAIVDSRIMDLERLLQNLAGERALLESKLKEVSQEPGRHEIIGDFKALVSSLPKDMDSIQRQMNTYKEGSYEIHSLRAKVKSLVNALNRKESQLEALSSRSSNQINEIQKLQEVVQDLKKTDEELKLFLEMYKRECTDSPDIVQCREIEYRAWTRVHTLQSSLDEHNLELRVKAANEAEAIAQQRLATAEAEIVDLRQKLEASERDLVQLSEILESKRDEGESYLSEIESIGQAYEDVQNKNQHLLQEITDRDDYNIKLAVEGVKAKQVQEALRMEIQSASWEKRQAKAAVEALSQKSTILDDRLRVWSEQVSKHSADGWQSSVSLENSGRRLADVQKECQQLRKSLSDMRLNTDASRSEVSDLRIELEKERFNKKRLEEDLEILTRKATCLKADTEGSSILGKLKQELREYKGILKCGICNDRQKEVVIAKCYHLFCHPCVRRTLESRHRKCPTCATSFGPNDVKPIYI